MCANEFNFGVLYLWNTYGENCTHSVDAGYAPLSFRTQRKKEYGKLLRQHGPHCPGTVAYIMCKSFARDLLKSIRKIRVAIDVAIGNVMYRSSSYKFLSLPMKNGRSYVIENPGMTTDSTQSSYDLFVCDDHCLKEQMRGMGIR